MNDMLQDTAILIISDTDWTGMMLQKQQWAMRFAVAGHPVCYVNKTPQRRPRFGDFRRVGGLIQGRGISPGHIADKRPVPSGIDIVNLRLLPPGPPFSAWNRHTVERFASGLRKRWPRICLITYTPTPAILHLLRTLNPWLSAYVCVHNYSATPGITEHVINSERRLGREVDEVFCDARYLADTWSDRLGRPVPRLMPACDPDLFRNAWRGDELISPKTIGFFGSSFSELDLPCYQAALEAGFKLKFIGPSSPTVADALGGKVAWVPPVSNENLPAALHDVDALMLVYRQTERNRGVIPGKFFECLATGKPLIMSPLPDMVDYSDCVNVVDGPDEVKTLLAGLSRNVQAGAVTRRFQLAEDSSWNTRFSQLRTALARAAQRSTHGTRESSGNTPL